MAKESAQQKYNRRHPEVMRKVAANRDAKVKRLSVSLDRQEHSDLLAFLGIEGEADILMTGKTNQDRVINCLLLGMLVYKRENPDGNATD